MKRVAAVVAIGLLLGGCSSLPERYQPLIGTWKGEGLFVTITPGGDMNYTRTSRNETTSASGHLIQVTDRELVMSFIVFWQQRFEIQQLPHLIGRRYGMTLDNVKLVGDYFDGLAELEFLRLPRFEPYTGEGGGYIAVYTRDEKHAHYSVGNGIYVAGLVRLKGQSIDGTFYPPGYSFGDDFSHDPAILLLCDKYFPELKGNYWVGGDTGFRI